MVYLHIFVRGGGSSKFELGGELELGFEWKFCKMSVPKFSYICNENVSFFSGWFWDLFFSIFDFGNIKFGRRGKLMQH